MTHEFETPEGFCFSCSIPLDLFDGNFRCQRFGCPAVFCEVCRTDAEPKTRRLAHAGDVGADFCGDCFWPVCAACGPVHHCEYQGRPQLPWMQIPADVVKDIAVRVIS